MRFRATLTTVPSRNAIPEPSPAARITPRPVGVPIRIPPAAESLTTGRLGLTMNVTELRLREHVDRLADEHPPIDLDSVDYTVRAPHQLGERFGHVLDYMARVELEVDRNVLELTTMLPDPPEIDRHFYADVWQPQEIRHGLILDRLQVELGRPPADTDLDSVGIKLRILGALAGTRGSRTSAGCSTT